jgi:endogenous inhibitor of DNA gyrase (YacG/DUF329 family)
MSQVPRDGTCGPSVPGIGGDQPVASAIFQIPSRRPNISTMDQPTDPRPVKRCPTCGKPAVERFRPFCSKRCADVDLNRWLKGIYAVPVAEEDGGEAGEPEDEA